MTKPTTTASPNHVVVKRVVVTIILVCWGISINSVRPANASFVRSSSSRQKKTDVKIEVAESHKKATSHSGHPPSGSNSDSIKPNVLFLITDQQRFDAIRYVQDELGHYDGHYKIDTPHLDRLLRSGAYFRNAYCQCPVCGPARASLRTGCTIERTGIQSNELIDDYANGEWFHDRVLEVSTLDHVLVEEHGYISEYYGKWHLPLLWTEESSSSRKNNRRTTSSETTSSSSSSSFAVHNTITNNGRVITYDDYNYETDEFLFKGDSENRKVRRYLDHFESLGEISSTPNPNQLLDQFTEYPYLPVALDSSLFEGWPKREGTTMGNFSLSANYTTSHFFGDVSMKALDRLVSRNDQPWLLTVSFVSPHPPMMPAWDHLEKYWQHRQELFSPKNKNIDEHMQNSAYPPQKRYADVNDEQFREWAALYYAVIEEIDHQIGRIIETLGSQINNTLIVFTADHGEMLGAHSREGKNVFYEEATHIPLIFSYPGVIPSGRVVDEAVSHLDVVATILDYVGASASDKSDGRTLRPMIENREINQLFDEDMVVSEWDYRRPLPSNLTKLERPIDERPCYLVRKGNYKLMMQKLAKSNQMDMMFDLNHDPFEIQNLLGNNATTAADYVVAKAEHMRCLLLDWMARMDGTVGYYSNPDANYGEGKGDMIEIRDRQSWKRLGFWVSDTTLNFGQGSPTEDGLIRHEYIYLGTRTKVPIEISSIEIMGNDASNFRIDQTELTLHYKECYSIKVTLVLTETMILEGDDVDAHVVLRARGHGDKVIPLAIPSSSNE